jgi:hypothetical protein
LVNARFAARIRRVFMSPASLNLVALIPLGPGAQELTRLDDLAASLALYAPEARHVVVLNDGNDAARIRETFTRHSLRGDVLPNLRAPGSSPWMGGLTCGLLHGYDFIRARFPGHHVLRLDSDALVIQPLGERLSRLLHAHPDAGLIGSVKLISDGTPPQIGFPWQAEVYHLSRPFNRRGGLPFFRQNLFGPRGALRRLIHRAEAHGYRHGYHANGGACLLTAEAIRRLGEVPELQRAEVRNHNEFTEDVFFSLLVHAVGLRLIEQQNPGDVFASCWRGLIGGPEIAGVLARDNCVLHSLKDFQTFKEDLSRAAFRARRLNAPCTKPAPALANPPLNSA